MVVVVVGGGGDGGKEGSAGDGDELRLMRIRTKRGEMVIVPGESISPNDSSPAKGKGERGTTCLPD